MAKPSFSAAWAASQRIYDPVNSGQHVAKIIGGKVAYNINHPNPTMRWDNTCAVRMSYILNYSGTPVPFVPGATVSGDDKRWYFYRVRGLILYLAKIWGKPEVVQYPPTDGGPLSGKKGLVLFEISGWTDAAGHATLFDGRNCYDHCYFNEPGARHRTERANFWSLS
ncbi:type VI secretion system amidase effector protein Tae4 [Bordetella genomosp. 13]|uniref:type VI secretion system amidase effector protein Tae4 n=1 Tax=Bordetella genomosp. 13 TaxID=463040 RepID=UPI00119DABCF|nr:type VI secretion system amidase effector protein Tae4 [Bordetella genomosp. 13]